jgi:hypothetical protein
VPKVAAYNAPSYINVCRNKNVYFTGNFTYWSASEENLELGVLNDTSDAAFDLNGHMVTQNFGFAPGFQVGIGSNLSRDNWDVFAQYTWFRNTDTVTTSLDPAGTKELIPLWGKPEATNPSYFFGQEKWRLEMDLVDVELGRTYYVGTALTFRPCLSIRGAFIRQRVDTDYQNETTSFLGHHNVSVTQKSNSWAVGPRAGLYSSWLVGRGFRVYGSGSGDILFTQYTQLDLTQEATTSAGVVPAGGVSSLQENNVNYLRAHLDLELGLGWGTYYADGRYHFDLSAGYGFQVFFNQNMFRGFSDDLSLSATLPNGDLFIQGLTVSARFDF